MRKRACADRALSLPNRLADAMSHCHDWVVRRSAVLEALNLRTGERVLDVGCGGGFYRSWSRITSGVLLSVLGAVQYGTSKVF